MVDVNVTPFEIEVTTRHGDRVRADVYPPGEGERLRLEISNWESAITEAPITHWYGQTVGVDTYHHDAAHPSRLRLHERPRRISP